MDRIRELDSFVAAVEAGSFVKAADALDTSKAVISKHVLALEQRLGVRLLNRTTRRQSLTDAGRSYFERAKQILEALEDADATVASSALRPTGTLRVTAPLTFGLLYLAPLWGEFMSRYPEVKLDITLSDRVGGEFPIKRQSGSGTERGNAAAKRNDQVGQEQGTMRQRVARAWCHRASGAHDARCSSP